MEPTLTEDERVKRLLVTAIKAGDEMAEQIIDARMTTKLYLKAIRAACLLMDRGKIGAAREILRKADEAGDLY
jgi:hypothetical protein